MNLILKASALTHQGQVRKHNEDSVYEFVRDPDVGEPLGLLIVADGVGGQKAGDIASKIAVETISEHMAWFIDRDPMDDTRPTSPQSPLGTEDSNPKDPLETRLRIAIQTANKKIIAYARDNPVQAGNMGTTLTCAFIHGSRLTMAHIGDSRGYRLRDGDLEQLTEDHSFVGQMVRDGKLTDEAYYVHPRRNVITRALGQFEDAEVDLWTTDLEVDDQLMLCSDGLWEMIRDPVLKEHLLRNDELEKTAEELIDLANQNGGSDNISIVLGRIETEGK